MKGFLVLVITTYLCLTCYAQDTITEDIKYTREIKKLATKKQVKTAFQVILDLEPKTIKNHIELTEIEAPPFKEMKRAEEFAERLRLAGLENVWIDSIGNVLGKIKL